MHNLFRAVLLFPFLVFWGLCKAIARMLSLLGGCPRTRKIIVFKNLTLYKSIVYKQDFLKIVYSRTAS